jgi:hypothetical protein
MSQAVIEILERANSSLAANCLRELPRNLPKELELEQQLSKFRQHLEQLKLILPALHARLLAEQTRLSQTQTQFNAAAAWIQANQKTL